MQKMLLNSLTILQKKLVSVPISVPEVRSNGLPHTLKLSKQLRKHVNMGNQTGKQTGRMAIVAMSVVTHIDRREMLALRDRFLNLNRSIQGSNTTDGNDTINRKEFEEIIGAIGLNPNDADILDKLFTMYDTTGSGLHNETNSEVYKLI